jgi:hypothetical protein
LNDGTLRLATECAKLDPAEEQQMADEGSMIRGPNTEGEIRWADLTPARGREQAAIVP